MTSVRVFHVGVARVASGRVQASREAICRVAPSVFGYSNWRIPILQWRGPTVEGGCYRTPSSRKGRSEGDVAAPPSRFSIRERASNRSIRLADDLRPLDPPSMFRPCSGRPRGSGGTFVTGLSDSTRVAEERGRVPRLRGQCERKARDLPVRPTGKLRASPRRVIRTLAPLAPRSRRPRMRETTVVMSE